MAADAISAARPGARRETLEAYIKGRLDEQGPDASLADIVSVRRETLKRAAAAGQNDRERQELRLREIERLEAYRKELPDGDGEEQFAALRSFFAADTGELETLAEETGERFDNAFRFLETAVGQSQELVLFVTEITAGYDTAWFVGEYGCEAYFRHNKELLFDDTRRRLLERIGSGCSSTTRAAACSSASAAGVDAAGRVCYTFSDLIRQRVSRLPGHSAAEAHRGTERFCPAVRFFRVAAHRFFRGDYHAVFPPVLRR